MDEEQLRTILRILPEDMVIGEILTRLPVKTLLRFKCVSKTWGSLIRSKQFIQSHLDNSSNTIPSMIVTVFHSKLRFYNSPQSLEESVPVVTPTLVLQCPTNDHLEGLSIAGSCNGLLCILVDQRQFLLWNPATGESKKLPDFGDVGGVRRHGSRMLRYGFGFDESSGDYKVYAVFYSPLNPKTRKYDGTERVYSLKADSWGRTRLLEETFPFDLAGRLVKGKLYWSRDSSSWKMLCFDLENERIGYLEKPSCIQGRVRPKIGVVDGCLCVVCEYVIAGIISSKLDVWILKQEDDSWSKLFSINKSSSLRRVYLSSTPTYVLFLCDGLFVLNNVDEGTLLVYNLREERVWYPNVGKFYGAESGGPELYTESLVSLALSSD